MADEPDPHPVPIAAPPLVPPWLVNLAALGWRVVVVVGLAVVLWGLASLLWTVTAAIAVAVVISAAFAPTVLRLRAHGRSKTAAAAIVWAAAVALIIGVLLLLGLAFVPYLGQVLEQISAGLSDVQAGLSEAGAAPIAGEVTGRLVASGLGATADLAGAMIGAVADLVTVLVLASFLVFFFLRDGDDAWGWAFQGFSEEKRLRITAAGRDALSRVGGYLRGTTLLAGLIAVSDFVFMVVLGVPLAVPLATMVFLGGFIPYFGGIVTTVIVLGVTLSAVGPGAAVAMLVLIGVRNVILGYVVRPALYGRSVSIHPALVLVALPAGYQVAGIVGLFAAVPLTAVLFAVSTAVLELVDPEPHPSLPGLVPAWLDRLAQWSWRVLVGIALVALLVGAFMAVPLVLLPVVLATILAASLEPLVGGLVRRGQARGRAAAIVAGGGFLAITGVLVLTFAVLVDQMPAIGDAAASGADAADAALDGQLGLLTGTVATMGDGAVQAVATVAQSVSGVVVVVVLGALLTFYFLRDGGRLWDRVVARARPELAREVRGAGTRAFEVLGGYMGGTAVISLVGAASQLVIMVLLGLPLALPVFVLSFFLCFIPYVGGFISTGIAFLITLAVGSPADILIMGAWTLVFNIVTGNVVGPIVYRRTVHIHPAVVLVGIPAAGAIAGVIGMFLVVPAIGVVAATWRTVLAVMSANESAAAPAEPAMTDRRAIEPDEDPVLRDGPEPFLAADDTPAM